MSDTLRQRASEVVNEYVWSLRKSKYSVIEGDDAGPLITAIHAALEQVVEECAKVADAYAEQKRMKGSDERYHAACTIAAAIRQQEAR